MTHHRGLAASGREADANGGQGERFGCLSPGVRRASAAGAQKGACALLSHIKSRIVRHATECVPCYRVCAML